MPYSFFGTFSLKFKNFFKIFYYLNLFSNYCCSLSLRLIFIMFTPIRATSSTLALNARQAMQIPDIPPFRKKSGDSGSSASNSPQRTIMRGVISTPPPTVQTPKLSEIPPFRQRKISSESTMQLNMSVRYNFLYIIENTFCFTDKCILDCAFQFEDKNCTIKAWKCQKAFEKSNLNCKALINICKKLSIADIHSFQPYLTIKAVQKIVQGQEPNFKRYLFIKAFNNKFKAVQKAFSTFRHNSKLPTPTTPNSTHLLLCTYFFFNKNPIFKHH